MKHLWMAVRAAGVVLVFSGGCSIIAGLNHDYEQESGGGGGGGGGSGGSGGGILVGPGGGASCLSRDECPDDTVCATWACSDGVCVASVAPEGQKCAEPMNACYSESVCESGVCTPKPQPAGFKVSDNNQPDDCKATLCDGMGGMTEGPDDTDAPADPTPGDCSGPTCQDGVLTPSGPKATGESCSTAANGQCCGTKCCANPVGSFCTGNFNCCASGKQCNGNCCPNPTDNCLGGACCSGTVCGSSGNISCCGSLHACEAGTDKCCPLDQRCPNLTCCPTGQTCSGSNVCTASM